MKRRTFTQKSIIGTGAMLLAPSFFNTTNAELLNGFDENIKPVWKINADGSIDLTFSTIKLKGIYPAIDNIPIKAIQLKIDSNSVSYVLTDCTIKLSILEENELLKIKSSIEGLEIAPHWFQPIGNAEIIGLNKFYYQGLGFAGPSGWAPITETPYKTPVKTENGGDENWILESYLVSGLMAADGSSVAIAALDHRNYLQKSTLHNDQKRWGLINRHLLHEQIYFQSEFSTENIPIPSRKLELPDLVFVSNKSAWASMTKMADLIATEMQIKPMKAPRYHWCSWYIKGKEFSFADLKNFYADVEKQNPRPTFQTVQIDDGHQKWYGDWLDYRPEVWPNGLKPAFELIKSKGQAAGVWIGAFMVHKKSKLFAEHPQWILERKDGTFIEEFGGDCVILDTSHPDAMAYIRNVFRQMRKDGATFYKTDFMDWGLQDSVVVKRHQPGKTSVQYYRETLQAIREEIGPESYWLACISPFAPFLGFADGVRAANDTTEEWSGNIINAINQMSALQYSNNKLFQTDPDVMYLNNKIFKYTDTEIQSFAYFCGIMGGSVNTSDWLNDSESVKLWRFLAPAEKISQATLPFWTENKTICVAVRKYESINAYGVLLLNTTNKMQKDSFEMNDLVGLPLAHVYKWNHFGSGYINQKNSLETTLAPHESALYFISAVKKAPDANLTIGGKVWVG
ncbi:MAG: glycoside hydrolase family 36 protein [Bacteroidota bacterium]|nr:glycoside hydrolase family 36 protein [Bacteroidota bacterium]